MANFRIDSIWKILKQKNIQFNDESYKNLTCIICNNILIEPYIAPCTCRFCLECINQYLQDGDKFCPGLLDDCKLYAISREDIVVDHVSNKKISLLVAKCPEENCHEEYQLRLMEEHLRICENTKGTCLFYEFGCEQRRISKGKLLEHFNSHSEAHSKLMLDLINNLKNEMKENDERNKKDTERNKVEITQYKLELDQKIEVITYCTNQIDTLKDEMRNKDTLISMMKQMFEKQLRDQKNTVRDESPFLKDKLNQIQIESLTLKNKIDQILKENQGMKNEIENFKNNLKAVNIDLKTMDMKIFNAENTFSWKIGKLSQHKGKNSIIWSDYFYDSEGDKLCLTFYPDGYGDIETPHVSVELCMSKFQCHEAKSFSGLVTIEILNQFTGDIHKSCEKNCKIEKSNSSNPFNFYCSELHVNNALKNDSILLRCCLNHI